MLLCENIIMSDNESNNKRIAKNTIMLYIRMLLSMVVGLYTSRVVLQTLGVEDYGIYGVVGGVVSMMGFLNASMSGATSRFITFELGRGNIQRVRDTFSSAMIIHIGIALAVFFIAETVGLWFLCNKLVIPEGRMTAAHWVYQCSIISAAVSITQTPYTAVIMSREKMDIYAYMELLNVSLKLGIVYLLVIGNYDKLILYSILILVVSVFMAMLYRIYCVSKFEESHFRWVWDKILLNKMTVFSGWTLLSECGYNFRVYGSNIVLNMFFGAVVNAASGVASTVQGFVSAFFGNVVVAFKPQIIKSYSVGDYERTNFLICSAIRMNMAIVAMVSLPLLLLTEELFALWLGDVPKYSVDFCRCLILALYPTCISQIITNGIQATGKVAMTSIVRNIVYTLTPVILYIVMRFVYREPVIAYWIIFATMCLTCFTDVLLLKKYMSFFQIKRVLIDSIKVVLPFFSIIFVAQLIIDKCFNCSVVYSLIMCVISMSIEALMLYTIALQPNEKVLLREAFGKVKSKLLS